MSYTTRWWDELMCYLWDGAVLGVTAYVVFWMGRSPWWFLLAVLMLCTPTKVKQ